MVYKCCMANCKGNYATGPKVHVFSFPKDEDLKQKWLKATCRKNFTPTKHSFVCELHFKKSDISTESEKWRLKKGAIPSSSILQDAQQFEEIFVECTEQNLPDEIVHTKDKITTFSDFLKRLEQTKISTDWAIMQKNSHVIFMYVEIDPAPTIVASVIIDNDLTLSLFVGQVELQELNLMSYPRKIDDFHDFKSILEELRTHWIEKLLDMPNDDDIYVV